jgi:hypothetical protein
MNERLGLIVQRTPSTKNRTPDLLSLFGVARTESRFRAWMALCIYSKLCEESYHVEQYFECQIY